MANRYVYTGGSNTSPYDTWAKAATLVATAITGAAAGDTFYIAHDHAESTAGAISWTLPGTLASPCRFLCVNRAGSVPPVSADLMTTATIATTGATGITIAGSSYYWYGVSFLNGNSGATQMVVGNSAISSNIFQACHFELRGTSSNLTVGTSAGGPFVVWDNCTVRFANVAQQINVRLATFKWRNTLTAILGATFPTTFLTATSLGGSIFVEGVDFSALGSGKTLCSFASGNHSIMLKDCKINASVTLSSTPNGPWETVDLIRCDSGASNYRTERYQYQGTLTTETTIVRTGGASDGTTPIAWKVITSANPEWQMPFECFPISIWNEDTGSPITVTVEGIWDGGATPLTDEIWMDVEYLSDASSPIGSFVTTTKADILAVGMSVASSSEIWGGSTTPFKLTTSITPQMKGPITVTIKAAKVSSTFYIDPKITLS